MNRISIFVFSLFVALALVSCADAQEIKFETADGKFKITGTVGYYVANGKPVESPTGDEKGLAVVIIRPDGKPTNPVPVKVLSTKTKRILFGSSTPPLAIAPFDERKAKAHQKAWAKHLGLPVESTNSIGMKFVVIPPGEFTMGSDNIEPFGTDLASKRNFPPHRVKISKAFRFGIYEVTQSQYSQIVGSNPSKFKGSANPVEQVTWAQAVAFCKLLSDLPEEKAAGRSYRLPTEAEWEYACRAGTNTAFSFGDEEGKLSEYAWYADNSGNSTVNSMDWWTKSPGSYVKRILTNGNKTHAVGQKKANAWGLYDSSGNVFEWCQDWFGKYSTEKVIDPTGPLRGEYKIHRGGCWLGGFPNCRSDRRQIATGPDRVGFRVVCVPTGK